MTGTRTASGRTTIPGGQAPEHSEQAFHDKQAGQRSATFRADPAALRFSDDAYLDHESWIRPAFARLGDVSGLDVLDYGCGHGMAAVVLALRGARVTAFGLSARVQANGVPVTLLQAGGERLPFAAASCARVWGYAVLHRLDLGAAAREPRRVLRPSGMAVFCEPWGENPLLAWARGQLPYPGKGRTPDERPLRFRDVRRLRRVFPRV